MAKMAKMGVSTLRRVRPADQKLGPVASRLVHVLTLMVSLVVVTLVIVVYIVSNWEKTVYLQGSVKIDNWVYDEDLQDIRTALYIDNSIKFCNAVNEVYMKARKCPYYRGCRIIGFREGSVIVDFEVTILSSLVEHQRDLMNMSELLILSLLKKPGASSAFADWSVDEYKIRLPGIENHLEVVDKLPSTVDICAAWQQKLEAKSLTITPDKECEPGWVRYKASCYLIFTHYQVHFTHAENYCAAQQSHLVFVESDGEENFLEAQIEARGFTLQFFWMGAVRDPVTTRFKWLDYSAVTGEETVTPMCYRKWQVGQPNNYGDVQSHVALINHAWDDVRGYPKKFYFICERELSVDKKDWDLPDWNAETSIPANLRIQDLWPDRVTVTWHDWLWAAGRRDGVFMLVYYQNLHLPSDNGCHSSGEASITLQNLRPSSLYKMAVQLIRYKPGGQSSPWFILPVIATALSDVGTAPRNMQISYSGGVHLSWDVPEDNKTGIRGMIVNYWDDLGLFTTSPTKRTTVQMVNITSLTLGQLYYFQVTLKTNSTQSMSPFVVYRIPNSGGADWQDIGRDQMLQICQNVAPGASYVTVTPATGATRPSMGPDMTSPGVNLTDFRNESDSDVNATDNPSSTPNVNSQPSPDIAGVNTGNSDQLPLDCEFSFCRTIAKIRPLGGAPVDVLCDNGWTTIQQNGPRAITSPTVDDVFANRMLADYKVGFGNLTHAHWIGNDVIHALTSQMRYKLLIEIQDKNGSTYEGTYNSFYIEDESNFYRLHVDGFTGNMEDSFQVMEEDKRQNGRLFSARSNHTVSKCPDVRYAGWWFNDCSSFLNGPIGVDNGISWGGVLNINKVTMKIKRNNS